MSSYFPALSVIIPVHNTEKYLDSCLQSIQKQTYTDYEVILIDDGSTDRSQELCQKYVKSDLRFLYFFQENGGSTSARKKGLSFARGKYITYVDSDDWLDHDYLERLIGAAENDHVDIAICNPTVEFGDHCQKAETMIPAGLYKGDALKEAFFPNMFYHGMGRWGIRPAIWGKIYKKELIRKHIERVDERMFYGEDTASLFPCCLDADCICVVDGFGYRYRINPESVSNGNDDNRNISIFENIVLVYNHLHVCFDQSEFREILNKQLVLYVYSLLDFALNRTMNFSESIEVYREKRERKTLWLIPEYIEKNNKKIILVGAGNVGKAYKFQLDQDENCEIVAWTDSGYRDILKKEALPLISIEKALSFPYDMVLIAVMKEEIAMQVKKQLQSLGVEEQKIVWGKPASIRNVFYEI